MTINWWTLGLQAVNVLILVWLLSRVFWRPVAAAIAARQTATDTMLGDARAVQEKADAALKEVTATRDQMSAERDTLLAEARKKAGADADALRAEAAAKAETVLKAAQTQQARDLDTERARLEAEAADLAVMMARKLLSRQTSGAVQSTFGDLLIKALEDMAPKDRKALMETSGDIEVASADALNDDTKAALTKRLGTALDGTPNFNFTIDPDLVAGLELRSPHFVLRNSWQADLSALRKAVKNAA